VILITALLLSSAGFAKSPLTLVKDCFVEPCELTGDFDGDGQPDRATLVHSRTGQKGIEVKFGDGHTEVLGAGQSLSEGGDDYAWVTRWSIHKGKIQKSASDAKVPSARGDSIVLQKTGGAPAYLFSNGANFTWYQSVDASPASKLKDIKGAFKRAASDGRFQFEGADPSTHVDVTDDSLLPKLVECMSKPDLASAEFGSRPVSVGVMCWYTLQTMTYFECADTRRNSSDCKDIPADFDAAADQSKVKKAQAAWQRELVRPAKRFRIN
jgi:hypothetical protein